MNPVDRRRFLNDVFLGAGGLGLAHALGWERALAAPPLRLVLIMCNNGTQQSNFWPSGPGFMSPILEPILRQPRLAAKTSVVHGLHEKTGANGAGANEHDQGFAKLFTGADLIRKGGPYAGGPSVDQIVAKAWGVETITSAVLTSSVEPKPKSGFDHRRSFVYTGPGVQKLATLDPYQLFGDIYGAVIPPGTTAPGGGGPPDGAALRARNFLAARKSILDSNLDALKRLSSQAPASEKVKLEAHADAVRSMEKSLAQKLEMLTPEMTGGVQAPIPKSAGSCKEPSAPRSFADKKNLLVNDESAIPELLDSFIDIMAASLACGRRRIATLQFGYGGGKWKFDWLQIGTNHHDNVAHQDKSDAGSTPENTARVVAIQKFYASKVARLALALDDVPEGNGTVLDNTLIVWGNELGRGNHSLENIPLVLVGGAGGWMPAGKFVSAGPQPTTRVGCTILNAMGLPANGFGAQPNCGILQGLKT